MWGQEIGSAEAPISAALDMLEVEVWGLVEVRNRVILSR